MPLSIRPIRTEDDPAVAQIIRAVLTDFGANREGFAFADPELDRMTATYAAPRSAYYVVTDDAGRVLGGGGVAPLRGGASEVCELQKMYFLPEARGHGMGEAIVRRCLDDARRFGFSKCYLETLERMTAARALYERLGFTPACPMGATGHGGCDRFYALAL
jgi:putative acetyltransferase